MTLTTEIHVGEPPIHPMVAPYANCPVIAYDTETTGLEWWDNTFRIGGHVLHNPEIGPVYIPVGHETMFDHNEDGKWVASSINRLASDPDRLWLMHNRVYDENVSRRDGIEFRGKIVDTMGLWWAINSFMKGFALKKLGVMVDRTAATEEHKLDQFIKSNKLKRYTQVPVEVMRPYAEQDGRLTFGLWELGMKTLRADQYEIHELEQDWIGLLSRMTRVGLPVDVELCQEIIDGHLGEAHQIRVKLAKMVGIRGFLPTSSQQVQAAAHKLGVHLPSTEMDALFASRLPKEIRDGIVKYRQLVHTVGSYLEPFITISRNASDRRVHTSFRTTTTTGRLAAGQPINLQGLPRKDGHGIHRVREVVRYPNDSGLARTFLDYAQIDVRLGTHYAKDPPMLEVMIDPHGDVHTMVMNQIRAMGIDIDRSNSKRLVFGSQYGIGKDKFAADVSGLDEDGDYVYVSPQTAGVWLGAHRKKFPGFPMVLAQAEAMMRQRGYVMTWDGKYIVCPEDQDPFSTFAWLVQAGGAQAIKRAMVAADKKIMAEGLKSRLALQVHDEVHVEGPEADGDLERATEIMADAMAFVFPDCRVPLYVQPEIGRPSWANKEKYGQMKPGSAEEWRTWQKENFDAQIAGRFQ